nr:hypothetical protein BaRGS_003787 [Batillaria attramentaria]
MIASGDAGRVRRQDPAIASLQNLVQQQASTIQTLEAKMAALEADMKSIQSSTALLNIDLSSLTKNVGSMRSQLFKQVAFSAHYSHYTVDAGSDAPLKFDDVVTNLAGGYDPATGIFTAPTPGVYLFYLHIINDNVHPRNEVGIYRNGSLIAEAHVEGPEVEYDRDSAAVIVHLAAGDTVYAKHNGGFATFLDGEWRCYFTGVLVTADEVKTFK